MTPNTFIVISLYFLLSFQIIFDSFSVGRFDEGLVDSDLDNGDATALISSQLVGELPGCPEGFMQVII